MMKSIRSRLHSSVAAIAICLCFASAAIGAEGDTQKVSPQNVTGRGEQQLNDAKQGEPQPNEAKPIEAPRRKPQTRPTSGRRRRQATADAARRYAAIAAWAGGRASRGPSGRVPKESPWSICAAGSRRKIISRKRI